MVNLSGQPTFLKLDILGKCCSLKKKIGEKRAKKSRRDIPGQTWKFRDFFHRLNPGIFYPGIFQESKSRDFLVPGFFDPGISRDIPGPGYPVDISSLNICISCRLMFVANGTTLLLQVSKLRLFSFNEIFLKVVLIYRRTLMTSQLPRFCVFLLLAAEKKKPKKGQLWRY